MARELALLLLVLRIERLRLQRARRKALQRLAYGLTAAVFLFAAAIFAHLAAFFALVPPFSPAIAAAIVLAADLALAALLFLFASRNRPSAAEQELAALKRQIWQELALSEMWRRLLGLLPGSPEQPRG
ncbi:MAG: hypothetical protein K6U10_04860 [Acidobacteriia bacterium]|nr:hypothetical protein [Methyloceanibacter sp.]MBX5472540.1 hypothetical protein [Acetobacteraceae bacterium]MCL6491137.1 hypothetical protein [Terriglobia bacterium]